MRWAWAATVTVTAGALAGLLWRTGGTFVYVIDDPAIHLAVARRLAFDATWGVVPGHFQSATSSPLWVLLLAPAQWAAPGRAGELVPLALALGAALAVVALLGPDLGVLRPGRRRPLDAVAAGALPVLLLGLPALVFTGMEHTLHMALVLAAALAVERRAGPGAAGDRDGRRWLPFALLAAATLVRPESAFVAVGLAAGVLLAPAPTGPARPARRARRARLATAVGLGASVAAALGAVAGMNLAYGQGPLPNSVMVKAFGDRIDTGRSPGAVLDRLTTDPLLAALLGVALLALVVAGTWSATAGTRSGADGAGWRVRFPATVALVTGALHVTFGEVDPSLRYEAYVVALGVWCLVRLAAVLDAGPTGATAGTGATGDTGHAGVGRRRLPAALVVLALVPFATAQARATATVPRDAEVMAEQRHLVARFLDRAYDGEPVAISELGYIALYHDGPLTDVYGLGDHEVAQARIDRRTDAAYWRSLQRRRGFRVVVAYPFSLGGHEPPGWIPVARWRTPGAYYPETVFWAAVPGEVAPLTRQLRAFEPDLPAGVAVSYNELAGLAAARALAGPGR